MSSPPLADVIACLAACSALAVLRDQDLSVAAAVAVGGRPGDPNGTAIPDAGPYPERTRGLAVPAGQRLAGQSRADPEEHHPGTSQSAPGAPIGSVRLRHRVQGACLPRGAVSSMRSALSEAIADNRTPSPRVAASRFRQEMSVATVPPVTQHAGRGTRARLRRFPLYVC